jgi:hypothetical protein
MPTRTTLLALALIPAISQACPLGHPNLDELPKPQPNQAKFITTIDKIDLSRRLITGKTETLIQPDGTELFYGTPANHTFSIEYVTPVNYINNPLRWISLRDLPAGTQVAIYGRQAGESIIADRILIPHKDPASLPQASVFPDGKFPVEYDKVCMDHVIVPMIFPMTGKYHWSDTFLASRGGGTRRHHGQDLMAPKLTPSIAGFNGTVYFATGRGNAGNIITLEGDNGWTLQYYHMNNDSPGSDDAKGTADYCFAPGLKSGDRVVAGQLIGWVGDSGNAEGTAPHIHFELWNQATGAVYNAAPSLAAAKKLNAPLVFAPAPDLPIAKGLNRYEGVIKKVDRDRKVFVIDLLARDEDGRGLKSITKPTREYLIADEKSRFKIFGMPEPLAFDHILIGDRISTIAKPTAPGKGQELTELFAFRPDGKKPTFNADAPTNPTDGGTYIITAQDEFLVALAKNALEKINPLREQKGLPPLIVDPILCRAAQTWTVNMADGDFYDLRDQRIDQTLTQLVTLSGGPTECQALILKSVTITALTDELIKNHPDLINNPKSKSIGIGHTYLDDDRGNITHQHYWAVVIGQ